MVIGFGVFLQVKADSVLLAGEGMSLAFVKLFKWEFGAVKTGMDCTLVCIGLACSLIFLPGLTGIREGTRGGRCPGGNDRPFFQQARLLAGQAPGTDGAPRSSK